MMQVKGLIIVFVKMLKIVFENYYIIQIFTLCTSLKKKVG